MQEEVSLKSIDDVKVKMIDNIILIMSLLAMPLVIKIILSRSFDMRLFAQIFVIGSLNLVNIKKKLIPFKIKMIAIFFMLLFGGYLSLYIYGVFSNGIVLIMCCTILLTVIYGKKPGFITLFSSFFVIFLIAYGQAFNIIHLDNDALETKLSPLDMTSRLAGFVLFMTIIIFNVGKIHSILSSTIESLSKKTRDLEKINIKLSKRIKLHNEAEKELKESKEKLQVVFENTNDGIHC